MCSFKEATAAAITKRKGGVYILIHIFKANYRKGLKLFVEIA